MADGRIIIDTEIDSSGVKKGISNIGSLASNALGIAAKTTAAMVTVATGAVAALTKLSIEQYAEYEQLTGGVETLFKNSSDKVMEYANNAYKTAGMSANEYMNTITGFSASLLQGLGGDTKKAAQIGNLAVTDMADNANKMGTAIENIQNAYQGFAKQNYTMLDNLKLGYGGTKTEMQRLLADAQKLTGVKYNINNFNDVIEAIHAIQNQMGITGTTAKEAASTIEGSLNMTKSAWTNLLTGMADDNADFDTLVDNLVNSLGAFGANLLPRIEITINGIGQLIDKLLPPIIDKLPELINSILPGMVSAGVNVISSLGNGILESLPTIINLGIQVIQTLITGIQNNLPAIATGAINIIMSLVNGIVEVLPMLLEVGLQVLIALGQGIAENLPVLIPTIVNLIISMCDIIIENLPLLISVAIDIILALVQGLITALPTLIAEVPRIINSFADAINGALPQILMAGIQIIGMLIKGLIQSIPTLIANIPAIIMAIVNAVTLYNWAGLGKNIWNWVKNGMDSMKGNIGNVAKNIADWVGKSITNVFKGGLSWGKNLISSIGQGFSSMISFLGSSARSVATNALDAIKTKFSDGVNIGKNLMEGIWNGIKNTKQWILDKIGGFAGTIIDGIKGAFDINSPSRIMRDLIGVNIVRGIGVGIDIETPNLQKDIDSNMSDLTYKMQSTVNAEMSKIYVSANANSTNNIKSQTTAIARLNDDDIEKLGDALSSRPNIMKTSIGEKEIIEVVAEPVRKHIVKSDERNKRKKGG